MAISASLIYLSPCTLFAVRERPFDFMGGGDFLKKIIRTVIRRNKIDRMTKQTKKISRMGFRSRHRLACTASGARKTIETRVSVLYKKQTKKMKRTT